MRLIDADEFFKNFPELAIEPYINAPTVEPQKIVTIPHELIEKLVLCVVDTVENIDWNKAIEAYKERPQGEWIMITEYDGFLHSKCSNCNQFNDWGDYPYCPWCGAKMSKQDESI